MKRRLDRRNRQWGSLRNAVSLRVRLSKRAKAILSALRKCEDEQISYGEVIERLVEGHAAVLSDGKSHVEKRSSNDETTATSQ